MFKALKRTKATGTTLLVLIGLASFADEDGLCYPSLRTLAKRVRVSRVSAVRAIQWLIDEGELAMLKRGHASPDSVKDRGRRGGFQATNYYQLKVVSPVNHLGGNNQEAEVVSFGGRHSSLLEQVSKNKSGVPPRAARGLAFHGTAADFVGVLTSAALDGIDQGRLGLPLLDHVIEFARRRGFPFTDESCQHAIDAALERRAPRAAKKESA